MPPPCPLGRRASGAEQRLPDRRAPSPTSYPVDLIDQRGAVHDLLGRGIEPIARSQLPQPLGQRPGTPLVGRATESPARVALQQVEFEVVKGSVDVAPHRTGPRAA